MTLAKRYSLALLAGAVALAAVQLLVASQQNLESPSVSAFYETCYVLNYIAPYLIGLTFVIGLVASTRETGPLALAPSLLMLSLGSVLTLTALVEVYYAATTNDVSVSLVTEGAAWAVRPLAVSLCLSAILFLVVAVKARRSS